MIAKSSLTKGIVLAMKPISGTGLMDMMGHDGRPHQMPCNSKQMRHRARCRLAPFIEDATENIGTLTLMVPCEEVDVVQNHEAVDCQ